MSNYKLVLDNETGGLDPKINPTLSVGLVILEGKGIIAEQEFFVHSCNKEVSREALEINKINLIAHDQHAYYPAIVVKQIMGFLGGYFGDQPAVPIGHNVDFDLVFLRELFNDAGLGQSFSKVFSYRKLDTQCVIRYYQNCGHFPEDVSGLGSWLSYFGVDHTPKQLHGALYDARVTAKLYVKLIEYGEKLLEKSSLR